jgi:hypothetical protein
MSWALRWKLFVSGLYEFLTIAYKLITMPGVQNPH